MVDPRAASGFALGARAYERGRPGYPPQAAELVATELELTPVSRLLDLAAGPGQLALAFHATVGELVAVEPVAEMREVLEDRLPQATVMEGTAERLPLADGAVCAVVVGEAFHWFHTETAAAEIARVLPAAGGLALLWNVQTWTAQSTPWLGAFNELLEPHRQAAGSFPAGDGRWRDRLEATHLFEPLSHAQSYHQQRLSREDFLCQVASWSWIANLEPPLQEELLSAVAALLSEQPEIVIPYRTEIYWTRRRR